MLLVAHATAAGLWIFLRPWGFAWWDQHLWQYQVVPGVMIAAVIFAVAVSVGFVRV